MDSRIISRDLNNIIDKFVNQVASKVNESFAEMN